MAGMLFAGDAVRALRRRDDDRRRRRRARLADGAAGGPVQARRQRRAAARPVRPPPPPRRRRGPRSGARSSTASCGDRCSRSRSPAGCCCSSRRRRSTLHTAEPGIDTYPQGLDVMKTYNRLQAAFPGTEIPANVVVKAADVTSAEVQGGDRRARAAGARHRADAASRSSSTSTRTAPSRTSRSRSPARGTTDRRTPHSRRCGATIVPETVGAVPDVEVAVGGFAAESKDFND